MFPVAYIIKCSKANEIQEAWSPLDGDFFYDPFYGHEFDHVGVYAANCHGGEYPFDETEKSEYIWLPRQDQIQRLVLTSPKWVTKRVISLELTLIDDFCGWLHHVQDDPDKRSASLEELWLAFAMYKLYKKKWHNRTDGWRPLG